MTEPEAEGDTEAELVSTIRSLKDLLQRIDSIDAELEDEFPMLPENADGRDELVQKCREDLEAQRNETRTLLRNAQKRLHRYRETGSTPEKEKEQAEKFARDIVEELREFCPTVLEDWNEHTHEEKKRIVAEKLRKVEQRLAFEEDPEMETYRKDLKSEWEHLQRLEELDSETSFDPVDEADEVFDGLTRPEEDETNIPDKVDEWALESYKHFREERGLGAEKARDKVKGLAEERDYYFSRSHLEKLTQGQV